MKKKMIKSLKNNSGLSDMADVIFINDLKLLLDCQM